MLLLVDGDVLRYRSAFAVEKTKFAITYTDHMPWMYDNAKEARAQMEQEPGGTLWSRKEVEPVEHAYQIIKGWISEWIDKFGLDDEEDVKIYLTGKGNFRESIAKTRKYKGNRDNVPKPVYFKEVGEFLISKGAMIIHGMEADDWISIQSNTMSNKNCIIVSNDKDLDQIPGKHYDPVTKEVYEISNKEAKTQLYTQLLTGDSTDNIPGLDGIGEAKARKILEGCKNPYEMVDACAKAYLNQEQDPAISKDYFLEQINLVFLKKHVDWGWLQTPEGEYFEEKYT